MDETFYAALGVAEDADDEAIRRAYRERVKERHPDVSDDPGAPGDFKRLTTARDVLVDDGERAKYDRLGHAAYVRRNLDGGAWATDVAGGGEPAATTDGAGAASTTSSPHRVRRGGTTGSAADRRTWMGTDWSREAEPSGRDRSPDESWQTASEAYRYTPSGVPTQTRTAGDHVRTVVRSLGPWLVVHAVFLLAAAGVAWLTVVRTEAITALSIPAAAFGMLLFGLALFLSALHVVSLVYA